MKTCTKIRDLTYVGLCLVSATSPLIADFIQPVAVEVTNGAQSKDTLIDGQGFEDPGVGTVDSVHLRATGTMWSGIGSIRESATFDLGASVSLVKIYVWNYNVQDATDVGMKEVEVLVSPDPDITQATNAFTAIARISLAEGGDTAQVFDVVGTDVRLVKLKGLSNWGQGYSVGLAEVRFESGTIAGNVPAVSIINPHEGDEIAFGSDIALDVAVTDKDGAADIQMVEFYDGDTKLGQKVAGPYSFGVTGAAKGPHAYRMVATDKTSKVAWNTVNVFVRELVADRIRKIDDTADEGPDLNQIQYFGSWNLAQGTPSDPRYLNNDHYNANNNKADYFEVRFKGVKIDLFGTVASHHGSGLASIDGGAEAKVNYKATQRAEQIQVWSSPILSNREHVLKVRVAGDGVVTADRFDVSESDKPDITTAIVKEVVATFSSVVVKMEDVGASVVAPDSVVLTLDGSVASSQAVKAGITTTITHIATTPFAPGTTHTLKVAARDTLGAEISNESTFTLPAPFFPLTGVGSPAGGAGVWGFRQIWNAGRADAVVSAVGIALNAGQPGFTGALKDAPQPFLNFALSSNPGAGDFFIDNLPFPAEADGLAVSDFVVVAKAVVRFPQAGDWTIGVHSDDGFALRFKGAPFQSVAGNAVLDEHFPEYFGYLTEGASQGWGILEGLPAGDYEIELIAYQRAGGAHFEVYAAEGAFDNDSATTEWHLIGSPGGLEIVSSSSLATSGVQKNQDQLLIDIRTPDANAPHQLLESTDLKTWATATGALMTKTGDNSIRFTVSGATGALRFYRVSK
jgi:Bacterial Ig domain